MMIQVLALVLGLAGEVDAQLAQGALVHAGEDDRGVGLAAPQLCQLLQGQLGQRVGDGADGQGLQDLVRVQARVCAAQIVDLQVLNGLDDGLADQVQRAPGPPGRTGCPGRRKKPGTAAP